MTNEPIVGYFQPTPFAIFSDLVIDRIPVAVPDNNNFFPVFILQESNKRGRDSRLY